MSTEIQKLIESANEAIDKIKNIPIKCNGFNPIYEWVDQIEEQLEILQGVYDQLDEGEEFLTAWENEESTGEEFFDYINDLAMPEFYFLDVCTQEIYNPLLEEFIENAFNYIYELVNDLHLVINSVAESVYHSYEFHINLD